MRTKLLHFLGENTDVLMFCLLVLYLIYFTDSNVLMDPGLGWHLLTGKFILESWEIIQSDPFLYFPEGGVWVHDQWLGSLILYCLYSVGGSLLLAFFCGFLIWSSLYLQRIFLLIKSDEATYRGITALWLLLCLLSSSANWVVRPVTFSFLMFSLLVLGFLKARENQFKIKYFLLLFLFLAVWSNLHGAWTLGLVWLSLVFLVQGMLMGSLFRLFTGLVFISCGSFFTPYTSDLHKSIFSLLNSDFYMQLNEEWLPPQPGNPGDTNFFILGALVVLISLLIRKKEDIPLHAGTLMLLIASLCSARNIHFFAISAMASGSAILLTFFNKQSQQLNSSQAGILNRSAIRVFDRSCISWIKRKKNMDEGKRSLEKDLSDPSVKELASTPYEILYVSLTFIMFFIYMYKTSAMTELPLRMNPVLVEAVTANPYCGSKIFSHPDWGGSLLFALAQTGGSGYRIFIDDRNQLSSEKKYRDFFASMKNPEEFIKLDREAESDMVFVQDRYPLYDYLTQSHEWKSIVISEISGYGKVAVFCRNQEGIDS